MSRFLRSVLPLVVLLLSTSAAPATATGDAGRLVGELLAETPVVDDLRELTDEIGGRPTGSEANERAVRWAIARFEEAGVKAWTEPFEMPELWAGRGGRAVVEGAGIRFEPRVVGSPYSASTPEGGLRAPLLGAGAGTEEDFTRLGKDARGAWLLVTTDLLLDVPGLFREYMLSSAIEGRAFEAGAAGVVYMGSRPGDHLYRMNASRGVENEHPIAVLERTGAERATRLLREGVSLTLTLDLDLDRGGPYEAENVLAEIPGSERPEEVVLVGAHLDSWGLGTGALDNGSNVCMLIDIARQITALGLQPKRTIRFALWNGEEQGLFGSWAYARAHREALDDHVVAMSFDIGTGRLEGFFTNGRLADVSDVLDAALRPVSALGPFTHHDDPIYGTDHFDFVIEGVVGLVGSQASANYGPHYHASSDTFDKVDRDQLRLNAAITAATVWGFAQADVTWERWGPEPIREMVEEKLQDQMKAFGAWDAWAEGRRGRHGED